MSSSKQIVLVTGGNNGIGFATCQLFAAQPNFNCLDITSDVSIATAVQEVEVKHGCLDVLIHNAGVCPTDFSRSTLRDCLETNAISPAMVTQAFAPLLLKSNSPRVVYVSSMVGSITFRGQSDSVGYDAGYKAYRTSKAALNMLVVCDAWEYAGRMKVFAFCPGYVITDLAGEREEKIKAGAAKSRDASAQGILLIAEGKRDQENGKFLHDDKVGDVYEW